jgi:hypothetical protein
LFWSTAIDLVAWRNVRDTHPAYSNSYLFGDRTYSNPTTPGVTQELESRVIDTWSGVAGMAALICWIRAVIGRYPIWAGK